ncbi:MAG: pyridoxamine 5'-phosphate oxidase family protein [Proteobacteria bacterium]|nr:pyridoxamine 5'-phosphate oxidase family protein [Pseudomonadota bacterium]MBU1387241.1 pyridoxamine 5'-phosphate oxidase family protein [Pseudomonadota bacterium]MBU1544901.1 pyridoxamine 5'-phosphate oxidase family protein [Pseudomonadota bacterium]MBU2429798.1 pyridoxamine 5'-phosphate oxidase family protein [Pseudomonadota bacterium]
MSNNRKQILSQIADLFESQRLAVLSTQKDGQPYANLVAFAATQDLGQIIFLTPRNTRKYENLTTNPKVAVLINNSRNEVDDIDKAICVTATGTAKAISDDHKGALLDLFLERHPHLETFSNSPETALVCISVNTFILVSQFQEVVEVHKNI